MVKFTSGGAEAAVSANEAAVELARVCAGLKCRDVRVLDVKGLSPLCDAVVLATAGSDRQTRSVARDVEERAEALDLPPLRSVRHDTNARWTAIDLVDVVVHVFAEDARAYYDLDGMWSDAAEVHWVEDRQPSGATGMTD